MPYQRELRREIGRGWRVILCDLLFIEAKCESGMHVRSTRDYQNAMSMAEHLLLARWGRRSHRHSLPDLAPVDHLQPSTTRLAWCTSWRHDCARVGSTLGHASPARGAWLNAEGPARQNSEQGRTLVFRYGVSYQALASDCSLLAIASPDGEAQLYGVVAGERDDNRRLADLASRELPWRGALPCWPTLLENGLIRTELGSAAWQGVGVSIAFSSLRPDVFLGVRADQCLWLAQGRI